ncbi:polysaccharide biosynthesis protein CapD [Oscillatoria nigro-viridis PCC 7112]|uniref:Polysaccharide biosynthesis protein CapD n=2 Tax=Phormidium nigroviride TaxID=482564 RepID=K9VEV5_9CYAN|nr:polysaccharide biosynthesis protein CapD [Oscillatoria nigro-viridis PCC 7112]
MNMIVKKISKVLVGLRTRHFLIIDAICLGIAPLLALAIRLDDTLTLAPYLNSLAVVTVLFVAVKLAVFYAGGFYKRYWQYAGLEEMAQITMLIGISLTGEIILFQALYQLNNSPIGNLPRSLPLLDAIISFLLVAAIRFSIPALERWNQKPWKVQQRDRVLIVGAGSAGTSLVQTMQRSPEVGLDPIAFIDDDPKKISKQIRKLTVVGNRCNIPEVVRSLNIDKVMIAIPSAPGKEIREIVEICQSIGIPTSTLPGLNEIINGRVSLGSLREVKIEDLLRRAPIQTDIHKVLRLIGGKKVLITGAGGSIGSELCRQILKCEPAEIIIVGHGENSVFNIQQELTKVLSELKKTSKTQTDITRLTAFIADIRLQERLEYVFLTMRPDIIFHAAAHKHVPMMELNPPEAITNNVRGTKNLLDLALKYNVQHFVMISTDKAVNPTSIMGASKRVAEMLVLQAAKKSKNPFVVVRFGNVLGSRGSVVPTFQRQIAEGGPITITHPDITRYFMTIPEAVQLVLQAAVIGKGGEVFMLEMGEPVRIFDLAKDLIRLSGYEVGKDLEIAFTGLRPGEKLFEELFIPGEKYNRTKHKKILSLGNASRIVKENINREVEALCQAGDRNDTNLIVSMLQQLVPEYVPGYSTANLHAITAQETTAPAKISSAASVQLENDLRVALANEEFRIHYQPIVCLETDQISGFEALLRWQHPNRGLLWPDEFLTLAEETGLILPIGEWVLRQACSQMRIWQSQFGLESPLTVSVNLTGKQFFQADLINTIAKILQETNLDASSLRLEIPEYVVTQNSELAGSVFLKLKTLGLQVQIDHCGLSDVSLTHLYQLTRLKYGKFDSLKLDCSLVSGLDANNDNLEILHKIMAIAQDLGMGMIATGVETRWQIAQLKSMNCIYGQGYFFSKPVECAAVGRLIGAKGAKS